MDDKIIVSNTKTMAILLEALGLRKYEWLPTATGIELNINPQSLAYAINATEESIQAIYGETPEWKELCGLYSKGMIK